MTDRRCTLLAGVKLLIVDDDEDFRYVVVRRLRQFGVDVREEARLGHVRERLGDWQPQVAVIDVHLPDGNGMALSVSLLSALPGLKLILLTGDADALSACNHTPGRIWPLLKPVSLEQLQRTILATLQADPMEPITAPTAKQAALAT